MAKKRIKYKSDRIAKNAADQVSAQYKKAFNSGISKSKPFLKEMAESSGKPFPWNALNNAASQISIDAGAAGTNCEYIIRRMMESIYGAENKLAVSTLDPKNKHGLSTLSERQIKNLLSNRATIFDKIAFKNLGNSANIRQRLRNSFVQAIQRGETEAQLIARIQKITGMSESQAMRVLETERTRCVNEAQYDVGKDYEEKTGKKVKKQWVCSFINSRESHIEMDSEEVDLDDKFSNGMMFPGESGAPPEEVINCRCRIELTENG